LLGTPHRGTKVANLGVTLGYCAAALGLGGDTSLLEALKKDSTYIKELVIDFSETAREEDIDVVCFFETYATRIVVKKLWSWTFSKHASTTTNLRLRGSTDQNRSLTRTRVRYLDGVHLVSMQITRV
jgi:hypothetical protein